MKNTNIYKVILVSAIIIASFLVADTASASCSYLSPCEYNIGYIPGQSYIHYEGVNYVPPLPPPPPPPPPPPVEVSCNISRTSAYVGESVTWTASAYGGYGSYSYFWSGSDGLSGSGQSMTISYNLPGIKTANVTVNSGGLTVSRTCTCQVTIVVPPPPPPPLNVSCSANSASAIVGVNVSWTAYPIGGNGVYTYSWSGTDGLIGNGRIATGSYQNPGNKFAVVSVSSGGQSIQRQCALPISVYVPIPVPLSARCFADRTSAVTGTGVKWTVVANGGSGLYTYSWSGTDGLYGSAKSIYKTYYNLGRKYASVIVYSSSGEALTLNCENSTLIKARTTPVPKPTPPCNCENNNTPAPSKLDGYCEADKTTANVGDSINWLAVATGGTGSYSFKWSGTDFSGSDQGSQITKSYSTSGTKSAKITITSGDQTIEKECKNSVSVSVPMGTASSTNTGASVFSVGGFFGVLAIIVIILLLALVFMLYRRASMAGNRPPPSGPVNL